MIDAEETEPQRLARDPAEPRQELRVAQNGAQALFGFLLTPAAWHRILFRHGHRERIVGSASVSASVGSILLSAAFVELFLVLWFPMRFWMRIAPR